MTRDVELIVRDSVSMRLWSTAFESGAALPQDHVRAGRNVSPDLSWSGIPADTAEMVVTCVDADAPLLRGAVHWIVCSIPPDVSGISEGGGDEFIVGELSSGLIGYNGPNPPVGHGVHHYFFWLYALDVSLGLPWGVRYADVIDAMDGHVLAQQRLVGTYVAG